MHALSGSKCVKFSPFSCYENDIQWLANNMIGPNIDFKTLDFFKDDIWKKYNATDNRMKTFNVK